MRASDRLQPGVGEHLACCCTFERVIFEHGPQKAGKGLCFFAGEVVFFFEHFLYRPVVQLLNALELSLSVEIIPRILALQRYRLWNIAQRFDELRQMV